MSSGPLSPLPLVVGLSGGLDSTVLLHVMWRTQQTLPQTFSLSAIHVHHGLQPAADGFKAQAESLCTALAVPLRVIKVSIPQQEIADLGMEAAARKYRYQAFAEHLPEQAVLALAHHRDDLLETALLQWIRGAGLEGLSAMTRLSSAAFNCRHITRWRPFLDQSRQVLLDYARAEGLHWVEDPSNDDTDLARNRIRHEVMPVLRSLREGADSAMARTIGHLQTARDLLELVTGRALSASRIADGGLSLDALLIHDDALASQIIRSWLKEQGAPTPPTRRLAEFLRQIRTARESHAQMDLAEPTSGRLWRVIRDKNALRIAR
ncbi:MAG: tRNA lysidine(34) synthetase TilS [Burkholderiaceae bacterium]|nr:tRNA lysidine(34) synthetase TilS [Burkholderiaceae bacterium]